MRAGVIARYGIWPHGPPNFSKSPWRSFLWHRHAFGLKISHQSQSGRFNIVEVSRRAILLDYKSLQTPHVHKINRCINNILLPLFVALCLSHSQGMKLHLLHSRADCYWRRSAARCDCETKAQFSDPGDYYIARKQKKTEDRDALVNGALGIKAQSTIFSLLLINLSLLLINLLVSLTEEITLKS